MIPYGHIPIDQMTFSLLGGRFDHSTRTIYFSEELIAELCRRMDKSREPRPDGIPSNVSQATRDLYAKASPLLG